IGARRLARDALGEVLVVVGMALGDVGPGQHHLRAHRLAVEDLLPAHLVRNRQDQLVALLLGHQRQADAGVAGRALGPGGTGRVVAALLGGLDHAHADAVLDGPAGILAFELEIELAGAGIQAAGLDDGRVGDEPEDGIVDRHAWLPRYGGAPIIASPAGRGGPVATPARATVSNEEVRRRPRQSGLL